MSRKWGRLSAGAGQPELTMGRSYRGRTGLAVTASAGKPRWEVPRYPGSRRSIGCEVVGELGARATKVAWAVTRDDIGDWSPRQET